MSNARAEAPSNRLEIGLGVAQGLLSRGLLYSTAVFDLLGGLGVVLPSVTRIKPSLTVLAALGCAALQACAIAFHVSRGEAAMRS